MIGSAKKTKEILKKYDIQARKNYGQNFLIDENILRKIVSTSEITKDDGVIEIGPGIGALTEVLLISAKRVLAYEIDKRLSNVIENELGHYSNLKIKNEDFLKANIEEDIIFFDDCPRIFVISNLPYYITTPIIFKLLESDNRIKDFYFMVQKEVGLRLTSKPNTKDYNSLSVLISYKAKAQICFDVSRNCFTPSPDVESVIIHIERRKNDFSVKNERNFIKFIQSIFTQRRKTLVNNINAVYGVSKVEIAKKIGELGFNSNIRSEELNLYEIKTIYEKIFESPNT